MIVHLYTTTYNDQQLLPFLLSHYWFCDKISILDDGSTDNTRIIASRDPRVVIEEAEPTEFADFSTLRDFRDHAWKASCGIADWVIVCDSDEFVWHPDIHRYLEHLTRNRKTIALPRSFAMCSNEFPSDNSRQITDQVTRGVPIDTKPILFDPNSIAETNFSAGQHSAAPTGHVRTYHSEDLLLLHYRLLGEEFFVKRSTESHRRQRGFVGQNHQQIVEFQEKEKRGFAAHLEASHEVLLPQRHKVRSRSRAAKAMQWFICLDDSSDQPFLDMTKVAVVSSRMHADLRPTIVFDGPKDSDKLAWFRQQSIPIIEHRFSEYHKIQEINPDNSDARPGTFLRCDLWRFADSEFYLYADGDIFFRSSALELCKARPKLFAACQSLAGEEKFFNAGVMVVNSGAARLAHKRLVDGINHWPKGRDYRKEIFADERILNHVFYNDWEPISKDWNWWPGCGWNENARLVHFCGAKPYWVWAMRRCHAPREKITNVMHPSVDLNSFDRYVAEWDAIAAPLGVGMASWPQCPSQGEFDEQSYLAANPDVKAAVEAGGFHNGLYHYLMFGRYENRKMDPDQDA